MKSLHLPWHSDTPLLTWLIGIRTPKKSTVHLRSPSIPLVLVVLCVLQWILPSPVWAISLVGMGGVFLIAIFWIRSLGNGLILRREIRFGWAQVGDQIEEQFTLHQSGLFPAPWVEINDHSDMPGYFPSCVSGVGGKSENHWTMKHQCLHRGVFQIGPTRTLCGDPFGIYLLEQEYSSHTTFVVMPAVVPLPEIDVAYGGKTGDGKPRSHSLDRTVDAASVRKYVSGDNLRWIHWKTYAKTDSLYVRLFDGTPSGDWWIVLDLSSESQTGMGADSTLEHAVILAASLAHRGMREKQTVGLIAHDHLQLCWLPPREGNTQFLSILQQLALVAPGAHSLGELLNQMKPADCHQSSIIIITADVVSDWPKDLVRTMRLGAHPTVLLLDPISYGGGRSAELLASSLVDLNIPIYPIHKTMLDQPILPMADGSSAEYRIKPMGGVVVLKAKRDDPWRSLG